jgi:hypothetical protein
VFASKKRKAPTQKVSRGKRRCCLTHVGLVCDSCEYQPLMPQYIVGNESTFLVRDEAALKAACPPNITLIRQKSAWNNAYLCTKIIRALGVALRPFLHSIQPILIFDAVPLHYHRSVLNACHAWHIWPIVVPARLTWLLQPLDTHFFYKYKISLKTRYQAARINSESMEISLGHFLGCVYETIQHTFDDGAKLEAAFEQNGFGYDQASVTNYIKDILEVRGPLQVPLGLPSDAQVKLCFPKKAKVCVDTVLRCLRPPRPPAALLNPAVARRRAILAPTGLVAGEPSTTRSGAQYSLAAAGADQTDAARALPGPAIPRGRRIMYKRAL